MEKVLHSVDAALAVFAHELRQPLSCILYSVRSIHESAEGLPDCRDLCEIVERQARYLAHMIDEALEAGERGRGGLRLQKSPFDLAVALAGAVEATEPLYSSNEHRLTVELPNRPVRICGDPTRVQQIVTNLLANAAKYTARGGRVWLRAETEANWLTIEVRDNGRGIPAEFLPRIFDLFARGPGVEVSATCGLGIGLALVKSLVELHGGCVSAHSDGPGAGSTFVVRLPGGEWALERSLEHPAGVGSPRTREVLA